MLLKGIPTMTANKAAVEQHVFITIPATLECPRACPMQVSCFISFWFVCEIRIVLVLPQAKSSLLLNRSCHLIPPLGSYQLA